MFYFSSLRVTYKFVALVTAVSLILSALPASFFVAFAQETTESQETTEPEVVEENDDTDTQSVPSEDAEVVEEEVIEEEVVEDPSLFERVAEAVLTIVEPNKVTICKATASQENPYNQIEVNENSLEGGHGQNGINEDDIVPPIEPYYPNGHNWSSFGQSIYENGCEIPKPKRCENNLLANGSFEEPEVTNASLWQKFGTVAPWTITKASDDTSTTLEIMRGWNGNVAAHGEQYVELDGDHSTKITQAAATLAGGTYELSWAFAPRHNIGAEQNNLSVRVDGVEVGTNGPVTGSSPLGVGDWQYGTKTFVAGATSTLIAFEDIGPSDSYGTFLDDAQLCLKKAPPKPKTPKVCSAEGRVVDKTENALKFNGQPVDANRRTTGGLATVAPYSNFLGKDGNGWNVSDFLSLGVNGFVTYEFTDKVAVDQAGPDIAIWEITGGPTNQTSNAKANVEVSQDGVTFVFAGSITGDGLIDIGPSGLAFVQFVRVTDNSSSIGNDDGGDGYDVDAITIIKESCSDTVTIVAEKIVCTDETQLPNRTGGDNIASTTAADWVAAHNSCTLVPDWEFEWASGYVANPGDALTGAAGTPWKTFGPTNGSGKTTVTLAMNNLDDGKISLREVLKPGYIPFTYEESGNSNNITAEFYCHTDVVNYDNLEYLKAGNDGTYHCVAWNVRETEPQRCEVTIKSDTGNTVVERETNALEAWVHPNWVQSLPIAKWIWADEYVEEPTLGETYTFENAFGWNPAATVTGVTLKIAADNLYKTTLNSNLVADEITPNNLDQYSALDTYVLGTSTILSGNNVLSSIVKNVPWNTNDPEVNPGGLYYELVITGEGAKNCEIPFEEDEEPTTNLVQGYKFPCFYDGDTMWCAEGGIEGWEITASNGEYATSTRTNEWGFYSFDLPDGDWTISEESRNGWEQVFISQNDEPIDGSSCEFSFGEEEVVSKLVDAQNTCDFGNYNFGEREYQLTGSKWNDLDADGAWDKGEPALSDWTIVATYGDQSTTTTTDENGNYEFWVPEGTWTVSEVAQSGWTQTGAEKNGVPQEEALTCTFSVPSEMYADRTNEESTEEWYDGTRCDFGNHEDEVIEEDPRGDSTTGTRVNRGPRGQVLGAATQCSPWIRDFMQEGGANDSEQVLRLQVFLKTQGFESPLTGVFDSATTEQVKLFQAKYASEVIQPWFEKGIVPHNRPTGFVYKMTRWKINNIVCPGSEEYPSFEGENLNSNVLLR